MSGGAAARTLVCALALLATLATCRADMACSQCDTRESGRRCITHPPAPRHCAGFEACITVATYRMNNKLRSFVRSCSPITFPPACMLGRHRLTDENVTLCYWTCEEAGCNAELGSAPNQHGSAYQLLDLLRR